MKAVSDLERRSLLVQFCRERIALGGKLDEVFVSIGDFFSGNADPASIGCNLTTHPGVETFAAVLSGVRDQPDVQEVLVGITDLNDDAGDLWPFSDRVYVVTRAALRDVKNWVQPLSPDDVVEFSDHQLGSLHVRPGHKIYLVWWD